MLKDFLWIKCFEIFLLVEEKLITYRKDCISLKCIHVTVKGRQGDDTFNPQLAEFDLIEMLESLETLLAVCAVG